MNENGRAQGIWMHMMQAAEQYIKSSRSERSEAVEQGWLSSF